MSSRLQGFNVMDVSSSLHDDPKVKRLAREHPEQLGTGFLAYVATMGESWKAGQRLTVEECWPSYIPFDDLSVEALKAVKLLEPTGRVTTSAWRGYFVQARTRREKSRDRWRRANDARSGKGADLNGRDRADTALLPRGANAVTAPPSDSDSVRPNQEKTSSPSARNHKRKTSGLTDYDAVMQRDEDGPGWMKDR